MKVHYTLPLKPLIIQLSYRALVLTPASAHTDISNFYPIRYIQTNPSSFLPRVTYMFHNQSFCLESLNKRQKFQVLSCLTPQLEGSIHVRYRRSVKLLQDRKKKTVNLRQTRTICRPDI